MATRRDVAERAGVSVATVSYVLNRTKNVTPEVRKRVLTAARELDYHPNLLARSLSTKRTRHVAMLIDNLHNPHYCEILEGAQQLASEKGYIVSVIAVDQSNPRDILELTGRGVDGVILSLPGERPEVRSLLGDRLPVVMAGESVRIDYLPAMEEMLAHLTALGHRRIAFLSGLPLDTAEHGRYLAWQTAMARQGLAVDPALVVDGLPGAATDEAEGVRAMGELLRRGVEFTAVYAVNDLMALGAMSALIHAGQSVPGRVSVVGCDQLRVLYALTPSLASMDVQPMDIGRHLMRHLIDEIGRRPRRPTEIVARYVPGESVAQAAI